MAESRTKLDWNREKFHVDLRQRCTFSNYIHARTYVCCKYLFLLSFILATKMMHALASLIYEAVPFFECVFSISKKWPMCGFNIGYWFRMLSRRFDLWKASRENSRCQYYACSISLTHIAFASRMCFNLNSILVFRFLNKIWKRSLYLSWRFFLVLNSIILLCEIGYI